MSQNRQNRQPPREPFVFDDTKLRLYAKPIQEGARSPNLRIKKAENNPVIEVDMGIKTEPKNGKDGYPIKIETPMSPMALQGLFELIKRVAAYRGQIGFEIDNWGKPWVWDKDQGKNVKSKEAMVISRFSIMKRDDGMVVFGVSAKNRPAVEFEFTPDDWHPITQNGQAVSVDISSSNAAVAWCNGWSEIYFQNYTSTWKEPEFQRQKRLERAQQHSGGNNNGQQRQQPQQYQQQPQQSNKTAQSGMMDSEPDFDDDIPF